MGNLKEINPAEFTTLAEFDDAIDVVNEECTRIEQQLNEAKGNAIQYGEYSEAGWYAKATTAMKIAKALKQKLARKRADLAFRLRQEAHQKINDDRHRQFIAACRDMLPKEQYAALWQAVDDKRYEYSEDKK